MNNSATGGYLTPIGPALEVGDESLRVFLQGLVSGVTGIPGNLVRPAWQDEPANYPGILVTWASVRVLKKKSDVFSFVSHIPNVGDLLYRNQEMDIGLIFYGPQAEATAEQFSLGMQVSQNLEQLQLSGYGLIEIGEPTMLADLLNNHWVERVDLGFRLRRSQVRIYPVLEILKAQVQISTDTGLVESLVSRPGAQPFPLFAWGLSDSTFNGWGSGSWLTP